MGLFSKPKLVTFDFTEDNSVSRKLIHFSVKEEWLIKNGYCRSKEEIDALRSGFDNELSEKIYEAAKVQKAIITEDFDFRSL